MAKSDNRAGELGARIRDARMAKRLSQAELAEAIGSTIESVSRAERGAITPTVWTLLAMADALDTDLPALLGASRDGGPETRPLVLRAVRALGGLSDASLLAVVEMIEQMGRDVRAATPAKSPKKVGRGKR